MRWHCCSIALLALSFSAPLCAAPGAPVVSVAHPLARESADFVFLAQIQPAPTVDLRSNVTGVIEKVLRREGEHVVAGDELFHISAADLQKQLAQAERDLQAAQGELAKAEAVLAAATQDPQKKLDLPSLLAQRDLAAVTLQVAQKQVTRLQKELTATRVLAPVAGVFGKSRVKTGDAVTAGAKFATLLGTIVQTDRVFVDFAIDERTLLYLRKLAKQDDSARDETSGCPVELQLVGEQGFPHTGRVDCSDNRLDPHSGKIRFLAEFPNDSGKLTATALETVESAREAAVRLSIGAPRKVLLVPVMAVGYDSASKPFVLTVDAKNNVVAKSVELGAALLGLQELLSGVTAEDWVIVGTERVRSSASDTSLSPDDFTTDIRTLRVKPGTSVEPVRVEVKMPSQRARSGSAVKDQP